MEKAEKLKQNVKSCTKVAEKAQVANVAYRKESYVSSRRAGQQKRHSGGGAGGGGVVPGAGRAARWTHGQAGRAVDGLADQSLHSCTILDNFYVDRPLWMVDLGHRTTVSGVIIVTWQGLDDAETRANNYRDYTHNLDKLAVYVDNRAGADKLDSTEKTCGFVTRLNDALFKPRLHVQCARRMYGRYVYIEAWGVANRWSRMYSAVLCEVMVYE